MSNEPVSLANVQYSAMSLLAMREHSALELKQKLHKKFDDVLMVSQVVEDLVDRNLQSDERFAEAFVKMRIRQGKGPVRILYDLKEKGISAELIRMLVSDDDDFWLDVAQDVRSRRFGAGFPMDLKNKAKQLRFLQYRGFTTTQTQRLFRQESSMHFPDSD